jgi:hypothetical protein
LRGLALFMIFVDHIPGDRLNLATMHNFGFCDAAEVFVLISGMSSVLAYGWVFEREGAAAGLNRILRRWLKLYIFQIGLLLTTLLVVFGWTRYYNMEPTIVRPFLDDPLPGIVHGLALNAVPTYLDILPLYLALFAVFPLIYAGLRTAPLLTVGASAALWTAANALPSLNLPNWADDGQWFFNPFAWQFLFTIGAALAMRSQARGRELPYLQPVAWLAAGYLIFAFLECAPWAAWHLPDLRPIVLAPPDKTNLAPLRLFDILALAYLILSSPVTRAIAASRIFRTVDICGRHSLEVFTAGCIAALFGRLLFHTFEHDLWLQLLVNAAGFGAMWMVAGCLDAHGSRARANRSVLRRRLRRHCVARNATELAADR